MTSLVDKLPARRYYAVVSTPSRYSRRALQYIAGGALSAAHRIYIYIYTSLSYYFSRISAPLFPLYYMPPLVFICLFI